MIQQMLTIWSVIPLPFLNSACTLGSSLFTYWWNLAWRDLSIILLLCSSVVIWTFFGIAFLWDWNENCVATAEFSSHWHIECSTLTASSFRILNSSAGIPSSPLALFLVMLPKAHLTSHSWMPGSRRLTTPLWLSGSLRSFCTILLCILATSS